MATFAGVWGITEIEAKVAKIVEDCFWISSPESFLNWTKQNNIRFLYWWDYCKTKDEKDVDLIPFAYFKDLSDCAEFEYKSHCSLRYLEITRELSLTILTLGYIPL